MTSHTATVEAMTAEVRVLMVGSRQVTMSVYGQLDHAGHDEIEPFGRVLPKDAQPGHVYVIGKHTGRGDLVSSWLPCTEASILRWVATRSSAASHESKSEKEDHLANQCENAAAELEKTAAALLGNEYLPNAYTGTTAPYGAVYYDARAAEHDQEAEEAEEAASLAEDEITRLDNVARAASYRHQAVCKRSEANKRRDEAAACKTMAQDNRTRAAAHRANAEKHWASVDECTERDDRERQAITEAAGAWSALPLIVLAGLR